MSTYESILAEAMQLSVNDRLQLFHDLWSSLDDDEQPPISAEWLAEIERRSAEYDAGNAITVPWEEVFERTNARLAARRDKNM